MISSKSFTLAGLCSFVLLGSLIALCNAAPAQTTAIAVRSEGHVAEYFDQAQLVKRINFLLFTTVLEGFGKVANTACAADIEPTTKAAICAVAVVGTVMTLLYAAYKAFQPRHEMDIQAASMMINLVPQIEGQSATKTLFDQYEGVPILMGYNDCYGSGCFEAHYHHNYTAGGRLLHHVAVRPRHNATTIGRRQDESLSGNDSGNDLYGEYIYHNEDMGTEGEIPDSEDQTTFVDTVEHDVDKDEWTNTGIHCFNVFDQESGDPDSVGYFSLNNDTPFSDPDNEDSYIQQCSDMGMG